MQYNRFREVDQLVRQHRNALRKNLTPKKIATSIGFFTLWTGLLAAVVLVRTEQDLRQQAATGGSVQLQLYAASENASSWENSAVTLFPGETVNVLVEAQPVQLAVSAVDMLVYYDPEYLTAPEIILLESTYGVLLAQEINKTEGRIRLAIGKNPEATPDSSNQSIVQLRFKTLEKVGSTALSVDPTATQIAALSESGNVYAGASAPLDILVQSRDSIVNPASSINFAFTYAGTPVENNTSFLKDAIRAQKVSVSLQNVLTGDITHTATLATDFFTDTSAAKKHYFTLAEPWRSNLVPVGVYQVLVKGPMHQQIRFCKNNQTREDRCLPTEGFEFSQEQDTYFDFTTRPLACGDLPISGANFNKQDGAVRVTDYSFMLNCLSKRTEPACVARADCNGDGAVTNLDMDLLLDTLSTAYDE
jgi:hypothetical protein